MGPDFLRKPIEDWPIKYLFMTDKLEGELVAKGVQTSMVTVVQSSIMTVLLEKYNSLEKLETILAYVLRWSSQQKARTKSVMVDEWKVAKLKWIKFVQAPMEKDLLESV